MVAQFSDRDALLSAYNDLLASGVPASNLQVGLENDPATDSEPTKRTLLQRLRDLLTLDRQPRDTRASRAGSPNARSSKADGNRLAIHPSCNQADVLTSIILSEGKLARQNSKRQQRIPNSAPVTQTYLSSK